jgi:hypothetical protein
MYVKAALAAALLTVGLPALTVAQLPGAPAVMSEAQVRQQLKAQGYHNIRLTPIEPNPLDSEPQLQHDGNSPSTLRHEATHVGWNGTASKDGRRVNVYVSRSGVVTEQ